MPFPDIHVRIDARPLKENCDLFLGIDLNCLGNTTMYFLNVQKFNLTISVDLFEMNHHKKAWIYFGD